MAKNNAAGAMKNFIMSWPESGSILWAREDLSPDAKKDILLNNAKRFYNLS